jgi:drug/metabolite transporter (DMT)-like permease
MMGVAFALLSAFSFALNGAFARRGLASAAASAGVFTTVLIGVPMFLVTAAITGQLFHVGELSWKALSLLSVGGVAHYGIGRYSNYRANNAMGATRTGPVQALATPYSVLIAFIFLDETITWAMAAAIALIMVGPAVMIERPRASAQTDRKVPRGGSDTARAFEPRQAEGYLFAIVSALIYGTSPILIRAALAGTDDVAILGGLIAYSAASVVFIGSLLHPRRRGLISAMRFSTVKLFFGAGFFVFLAQMFSFIALSIAPVAIVSPLMRTSGLFMLVLSWAVNRHLEKITLSVVLGILISVAGSLSLILVRQ